MTTELIHIAGLCPYCGAEVEGQEGDASFFCHECNNQLDRVLTDEQWEQSCADTHAEAAWEIEREK